MYQYIVQELVCVARVGMLGRHFEMAADMMDTPLVEETPRLYVTNTTSATPSAFMSITTGVMVTFTESGSVGEPVQDHSRTGFHSPLVGVKSHTGAELARLLVSSVSATTSPLSTKT